MVIWEQPGTSTNNDPRLVKEPIQRAFSAIRTLRSISVTQAKFLFFSFFSQQGWHTTLSSLVHRVLHFSARLLLADRGAVQLGRVLPGGCWHDSLGAVGDAGLAGALPVAEAAGLQQQARVRAVRLLGHHARVHHGGHGQQLDIRVSVGHRVPPDAAALLQVGLALLLRQRRQGLGTGSGVASLWKRKRRQGWSTAPKQSTAHTAGEQREFSVQLWSAPPHYHWKTVRSSLFILLGVGKGETSHPAVGAAAYERSEPKCHQCSQGTLFSILRVFSFIKGWRPSRYCHVQVH